MESSSTAFPRVTIQFCTQCKWMLRAAYFAQELLSTFSTSLGEVALQPSSGGTFIVKLYDSSPYSDDRPASIQEYLLWDRKTEGGFPEIKELKKRVRNIIDPTRDLGHVDGKKSTANPADPISTSNTTSSSPTPIVNKKLSLPVEVVMAGTLTPGAVNRLQVNQYYVAEGTGTEIGEGKFTPINLNANLPRASAVQHNQEVVGANGKIKIGGGEGFGFCRPGDEDCG